MKIKKWMPYYSMHSKLSKTVIMANNEIFHKFNNIKTVFIFTNSYFTPVIILKRYGKESRQLRSEISPY